MKKVEGILTPAERDQSGWSKAEKAINDRLTQLRAKLESTVTSQADREATVHRIDELKKVLALAQDPKTN